MNKENEAKRCYYMENWKLRFGEWPNSLGGTTGFPHCGWAKHVKGTEMEYLCTKPPDSELGYIIGRCSDLKLKTAEEIEKNKQPNKVANDKSNAMTLRKETEMKDYVGRTLSVGDRVVYFSTGKDGFMEKTSVTGFTAKMVKLASSRTVWADHLVIYEEVQK